MGVVDNIRLTGIGGTRNFDTQYSNDNLGRLLRARQGSLSGTTLMDLNGNGTFTDAGDETQSSDATFNDVNELTSRTFTLSGGGSPTTYTYVYDANGNMTDDGKDYTYKYDAFGRLKEVWTRGGGAVKKSEYTYNGLGYRIGWHYDVSRSGGGAPDGVVDSDDPWYWWMHDERWRQIATFRGDDDDPKERFVYHAAGLDGMGGSSYIDAVVLRDKDNSDRWRNESDGVLEQRRYICQTWRNDTALIATDVGALVEATKFAGYGESFNVPAGDVNSDGDWDAGDSAAITGGYDVNKDIDMDGSVGAADVTAADAVTGGYHAEGRGVLSADEVAIRKGYAGYEVDPILLGSDLIAAIHHVRNRVLSSYTGRWSRRDPLGYVDGMGLYESMLSAPIAEYDDSGLSCCCCATGLSATASQNGFGCGASLNVTIEWDMLQSAPRFSYAICQLEWWEWGTRPLDNPNVPPGTIGTIPPRTWYFVDFSLPYVASTVNGPFNQFIGCPRLGLLATKADNPRANPVSKQWPFVLWIVVRWKSALPQPCRDCGDLELRIRIEFDLSPFGRNRCNFEVAQWSVPVPGFGPPEFLPW